MPSLCLPQSQAGPGNQDVEAEVVQLRAALAKAQQESDKWRNMYFEVHDEYENLQEESKALSKLDGLSCWFGGL